jgi:hypothetical protein
LSPLYIEGPVELAALEPQAIFSTCESFEIQNDNDRWKPGPGPRKAFEIAHGTAAYFRTRSRMGHKQAEYIADVWLTAKEALKDSPKLFAMYQAWREGALNGVPANVLARSPEIREIKTLVGYALMAKELDNIAAYFSRLWGSK